MIFGELKVGETFISESISTYNKIYMKIRDEEGWEDIAIDLKTGVATFFHKNTEVIPFPFTINFTVSI